MSSVLHSVSDVEAGITVDVVVLGVSVGGVVGDGRNVKSTVTKGMIFSEALSGKSAISSKLQN